MNKPKSLVAGVMLTFATLLAGPIHAASFDEKLKAPRAATSQALRTKLEAHFATFDRMQQQDPAAFIRDRAAHRQWSDLYFAVKLAMDERVPLKDLATYGLIAAPDGTYAVDLKTFPQWEPLDSRLYVLSNPEVFESYVPSLEARGFRADDVSVLRIYLATHDPRLAMHADGRQLIETFAERLRSTEAGGTAPRTCRRCWRIAIRRPVSRRKRERQWAVGLLDALDKQRQRILVSLLDESRVDLTFDAPAEPLDSTLEKEVQPIVSGEYVADARGRRGAAS